MINIIIIDDQSLLRDGLEIILNASPEINVSGCGANGQEAVELVEKLKPDLVLMDIRMPVMDGVQAARIIRERFPEVKILLLTTFDDEELIIDAMSTGVSGYVFKDIEKSKLMDAIKDCVKGTFIMPSRVAEVLAKNIPKKEIEGEKLNLTDREMEIAVMLSQGFTNRQIASALYISDGTVKNYVSSIYNKTGIKDRIKLALYLKEKGIK